MLSGCCRSWLRIDVHHFGEFHHLALELIDDYIPHVTWPKSQATVMIDVQTIPTNISQIQWHLG